MTEGEGSNPTKHPHTSLSEPSVEFYIPSNVSQPERWTRTLKHGDTFAIFDHYGDFVFAEGTANGLYHKDTRYLSELRLFINGCRPLLLSSTIEDDNALLTVDLTNPDFMANGKLDFPRDTIWLVRSKFLWKGTCYERLRVRNFDSKARQIELAFRFQSDFADIFEVRGHKRTHRGETNVEVSKQGVSFVYRGLDNLIRRSVLRFDPAPREILGNCARFPLRLEAGQGVSLFLSISCADEFPRSAARSFFGGLRAARRNLRASTASAASVASSNQILNEIFCRTMADLYMLITDTNEGPFPYAGIPWFSTPFGRDAIITATEMLWIDPGIAKGVLKFLAVTQAKSSNPESEAEPGKILHECRSGEMARLGEVPFAFYYGSVDSTPLFVVLAGLYFERTGDLKTMAALWPHIDAALQWIADYGDRDGDGFVEYERAAKGGLVNQGWKDSGDSLFHADGSDALGAIALCEVQGYVFAAKQGAAIIAGALGFAAYAEKLRREAEILRDRFEAAFWCDDIGTYAIALDGHKRVCKVRSSNAGQVLFSGIAQAARARLVADQLLGAEFFSGWGVRTIASSEIRYNPMSYHNGSVWPHDNALIALGFARYGLKQHAERLFTALFEAAAYMDLRRLPELFCGFRRSRGKGPTLYPVACSPQAWSCTAPFALLQACLGLEVDFAERRVGFRQPRLPHFLDEVTIRSLAVGGGRVDILLRRYGAEVSVNLLRRTGDAHIRVTL
jgi:glycogen debranching enzyme